MNFYNRTVKYIIGLLMLVTSVSLKANNISVSNITLTGRDVSAGVNNAANFSMVQFNLSWENSWRKSGQQANWDAAWVFVKYRRYGGTWQHAWLNNTGHTAASGSTIDVGLLTPGSAFNASTNPGLGAFVYRSSVGSGSNSFTSMQLRWNYGAQSIPDTAVVDLQVFAIEMVYVPQGSFYVGDGTVNRTFSGASSSGTTITLSSSNTSNLRVGDYIAIPSGSPGSGALAIAGNTYVASILSSTQFTINQAPATALSGRTLQTTRVEGHLHDATDYTNMPPFQVTGESQITLGGTAAGNLARTQGTQNNTSGADRTAEDFNSTTTQTLPAAFPKGFKAFYCMKYEISQGQYRDFLNTLSRAQQANRTETNLASGVSSVTNRFVLSNTSSVNVRSGIACDATINSTAPITFYCDLDGDAVPNESTDGEWIACNFINWVDAMAYSDWSGLRPMTELEFEKACRGPLTPIAGEYAWGSIDFIVATGLSNSGMNNEITTPSNANVTAGNGIGNGVFGGPARVGHLAGAQTNRILSGASYYGILNLSDNLYERLASMSYPEGRSFDGSHGDGNLSSGGFADLSGWPGYDSGGTNLVTNTKGSGMRGNSFVHALLNHQISNRSNINYWIASRDRHRGYRGVRTAP